LLEDRRILLEVPANLLEDRRILLEDPAHLLEASARGTPAART